jgi:hypothetical protein
MNYEHLYTEEEIITIGEFLKSLKGKILLDDQNEFFVLKDYDIKSMTYTDGGWFKKKINMEAFYIDFVTLEGDKEYIHQDDSMCSAHGVRNLMRYHLNFNLLESKLMKFTLKNGITLKYGELTVSKTNKSSNFKRR